MLYPGTPLYEDLVFHSFKTIMGGKELYLEIECTYHYELKTVRIPERIKDTDKFIKDNWAVL